MPASFHTDAFIEEVIGTLCIAHNVNVFRSTRRFRCIDLNLQATGNTDDAKTLNQTSPNLLAIKNFIRQIETEVNMFPSCRIVVCAEPGELAFHNAILLLGAFMILRLKMSTREVVRHFSWLPRFSMIASDQEKPQLVGEIDWWDSLEYAQGLGWLAGFISEEVLPDPSTHKLETERQIRYSELPVIVPNKLVIFEGQSFLGISKATQLNSVVAETQHRPSITAAVYLRLDLPEIGCDNETPSCFEKHVLSLPVAATVPPLTAVDRFLAILDQSKAAVALECSRARRQGEMLAALYLMRRHGFAAGAAIAWLGLVWPGAGGPFPAWGRAALEGLAEASAALARAEAARRALLAGWLRSAGRPVLQKHLVSRPEVSRPEDGGRPARAAEGGLGPGANARRRLAL